MSEAAEVAIMPIYEYKCDECGHQFETKQRMAEDPLETCPECEGDVRRLINGGLTPMMKGSRKGGGGGKSCSSSKSCSSCSSSCH